MRITRLPPPRAALVLALLALALPAEGATAAEPSPRVRHALFVVVDGVYNSELMAPYDVLQHSVFRDPQDYLETAVVSPDGGPVTTFEGITISAHYGFDDAPPVDVLVIPSTRGSMDADLENEAYMGWLRSAVAAADWVITVCDGAFPLAATGALDGRSATTFPADRERLASMFSEVDVRHDVRLVVDGKFVTSVGGAMSYEPAFWLVERLFGAEHAAATARGLVWPWDLADVPHLLVGSGEAKDPRE